MTYWIALGVLVLFVLILGWSLVKIAGDSDDDMERMEK